MSEAEIAAVLDAVMPGRAFVMLVPQGTSEPYLVIQRIWSGPVNSLCGYMHTDEVRYQVDSYAKSHRQAKLNMDDAVAALRACPEPPNVESEQDLYEQDTKLARTTINLVTWYEPLKVMQ
jgi:hypothetical protein